MSVSDINDFNGPVADFIKIANESSRAGMDIKDMINILRRPDKKEVLKEIKEYAGRSKIQNELEKQNAQRERARDFGIGE